MVTFARPPHVPVAVLVLRLPEPAPAKVTASPFGNVDTGVGVSAFG